MTTTKSDVRIREEITISVILASSDLSAIIAENKKLRNTA